jgi:UDP-N-acetylmuramyl tripeptide synthase
VADVSRRHDRPLSTRARTRAAITVGRAAAWASRRSGRGAGEIVGGKIILRLAPTALTELGAGRAIACVSGTNGKTTTTRLLAAALGGPVASNSGGANMPPGVVTALAASTGPASLEVDELHLPAVATAIQPQVVCLLNLSRDQLDRASETRRIAGLWRLLGSKLRDTTAVANADDPLVVWAAGLFTRVRWVGAGQAWTADAMVCPCCAELLRRDAVRWWCPSCGLERPETELDAAELDVQLTLPGRCNVANAAIALVAAEELTGVARSEALQRMASVEAVAGRYATITLAGREARLLLAKNPAGWVEMLELVHDGPLVIHFHARVADGRDPSWIWDVPFASLIHRVVHVSGDRAEDMVVRLRYAGIEATRHATVEEALLASPDGPLDLLATYTAFREVAVAAGVVL